MGPPTTGRPATGPRQGAPVPATIRSVVAAGLGTYRRRFGRVVLAAVLVFAPIDLIVTLSELAAKEVAENADILSLTLYYTNAAISVAGTTLSTIFFAGIIDRIVAVDQYGHEDVRFRDVLRHLPAGRLALAALLASALILVGLVLLIVPGVILMVLFAIVGPLIVIERLHVVASLRRSAQLVWPHFVLATVVVFVPTSLEEWLASWFEHLSWYEHPWVRLPVDVGSTILVGGLVGVIEVTLAYALIADHKRRQEAKATA